MVKELRRKRWACSKINQTIPGWAEEGNPDDRRSVGKARSIQNPKSKPGNEITGKMIDAGRKGVGV